MKKLFIVILYVAIIHPEVRAQVYFGIFEEGIHYNIPRLQEIQNTELGKKPGVVMYFQTMTNIDVSNCNNLISNGYTPMITLEAFGTTLDAIIAGNHDTYWRSIASQIKQINGPILMRWCHEMNGNWYPWSGAMNSNSPSKYVQAWRHVHNIIMNEQQAKNCKWVWCINNGSVPNEAWNAPMNYYPGSEYVDWLSIDAYDFTHSNNLEGILSNAYTTLTNAIPNKPIIIGEIGVEAEGYNPNQHKLTFLNDGGSKLFSLYPKIKGFVWFNVRKQEGTPLAWKDFRYTQSEECRLSFRNNWIQNPQVVSGNANIEYLSWSGKCLTSTINQTIQAENWCYMSGTQVEPTTDAGGGLNLGWLDPNDWITYSINIPKADSYIIEYRVASTQSGGILRFEKGGGSEVFGTIAIPNTGGWQNWTTITHTVNLPQGVIDAAIVCQAGGYNINWMSIKPASVTGIHNKTNPMEASIFPNPASDMLQLNTSFGTEYMVQIVNLEGETVYQQRFKNAESTEYIQISHLSKGMYLIKMISGNEQKSSLFVKE